MKQIALILISLTLFNCKKKEANVTPISDANAVNIKEDTVLVGNHKLATYYTASQSKYLIVFESGMGDDHSVWQEKRIAENLASKMDVLMYDRAGYGKSTIDSSAGSKNINQVRLELETVVNKYANGRKIILVGHSIAGLFLRNYAAHNASKLAGMVFIDPSHEKYQDSTRQDVEDILYYVFSTNFGANSGAAKEANEFIEYLSNAGTLPSLPNIPVIVLTSMKEDASNNSTDQAYGKTRQDWYYAHESLKNGVTEFTHFGTINSGHYIMRDETELVKNYIQVLLSKLPK